MISSVTRTTLNRLAKPQIGAIRCLNVHEYISMETMNSHHIATPLGAVATTAQEAEHIYATKFAGKDAVIKAQVLSGGRGLGTFKNGFKGGVHMVTKADQVRSHF